MEISKCKLYSVMLFMIITGSCNTLLLKAQQTTITSDGNKFIHPYFQGCNTFIGMLFCLSVHYLLKYIKKQKKIQK